MCGAAEAPDPHDRALWLVGVAPHVSDGWTRVVAAAAAIDDEDSTDYRVRALLAAAPHVPGGWGDALVAAAKTEYPKDRSRAIMTLAPRIPDYLLSLVIDVAKRIDSDDERANALAA